MKLQKAIELLTEYQKWRLGNDDIPSPIPKVITEALYVLLNYHTETKTISDEEIEKGAETAWSDYEYEEGNLYSTTFKGGWKLGIKWYREQLKLKT